MRRQAQVSEDQGTGIDQHCVFKECGEVEQIVTQLISFMLTLG